MKTLCVIPARGGSKRLKHKNMFTVCGHPMLYWSVLAALEAGFRPVVSSENHEILDYASSIGAEPLLRPLDLSADTSTTESVLIHALDSKWEDNYDYVMCLPPTSPLRGVNTIIKVLSVPWTEDMDCVMTVTDYRGDLWIGNGRMLERIAHDAPRRQQDRMPYYEENSAVYLTRASSLWMTRSVLGNGNVVGVTISKEDGWDVNTELDARIADFLLTDRMMQRSSSL